MIGLVIAGLLLPADVRAASICTGSGPEIHVRVEGLKDRSGRLKLELFPPVKGDFLQNDSTLASQGKVYRRVRIPTPPSGNPNLCIRAPAPGRYALFFTHDRDGRNKFSIWSDGAGLPHNDQLGRSRPKVEDGLVDVGPGGTSLTIRAQYLHGLSGFGPVG